MKKIVAVGLFFVVFGVAYCNVIVQQTVCLWKSISGSDQSFAIYIFDPRCLSKAA